MQTCITYQPNGRCKACSACHGVPYSNPLGRCHFTSMQARALQYSVQALMILSQKWFALWGLAIKCAINETKRAGSTWHWLVHRPAHRCMKWHACYCRLRATLLKSQMQTFSHADSRSTHLPRCSSTQTGKLLVLRGDVLTKLDLHKAATIGLMFTTNGVLV